MSRKKIMRVMRKYDIRFRCRKKDPCHPIGADGEPKAAPYLLRRGFFPGMARKHFAAGIAYTPSGGGFVCPPCVFDMVTSEPVAHAASTSPKTPFVLATPDQMKGLDLAEDALINSDMGAHRTSRAYREKAKELGLVQPMSHKANCWDNACIESWFGWMKAQLEPTGQMSAAEVIALVGRYVEYYRCYRGQGRLGWLTPCEYAQALAA